MLSVAFSPDGSKLAVGEHVDLVVYDLAAHEDSINRWVAASEPLTPEEEATEAQ
jgi:hypothetical protein